MQDNEGSVAAHGFHLHDGGGEAVRGQAAPVGPLGLTLGGKPGWSGYPRVQITFPLVLLRLGGTRQVREKETVTISV